MTLNELSLRQKDQLADLYRRRGVVTLREVDLPDSFTSAKSDVVFLRVDTQCEVYVSAAVAYCGQSRAWQQLCRGQVYPGNARRVAATRGDIFTGLQTVVRLLEEAGGAYAGRAGRGEGREMEFRFAAGGREVGRDHDAVADRPVVVAARELFEELRRQVRGQDHVLRTLARRLSRHLARRDPRRPATFFAVGPTGVGKTSTAEGIRTALARLLPAADGFGYLRIDASEYAEEHRVSQLLGAPPGYIGYGDGGQLIDALMANPRTVVLFDEIEKAHPVILRVLLNLLDLGRLSSPGRSRERRAVDARRAVLFFTTNLRCEAIYDELSSGKAVADATTVDATCRRHLQAVGLAPELIGRIGSFLAFSPLSRAARAEIIGLAISRVAGEYGLEIVDVTRPAMEGILERVSTSDLGARPDEYLVDELLGDAFVAAAIQGGRHQWRVAGPPFQCERVE